MILSNRVSWAAVPLFAATLLLAPAPAHSDLAINQLTDGSSASCGSYLPAESSSGSDVAFESDCDLAGNNADGNFEVFLIHDKQQPQQLTDASGACRGGTDPGAACGHDADCAGGGTCMVCSSGSASVSDDGTSVAFESDCDLTGANADRNTEIFLWNDGSVSQLTVSIACDNFAPSIDAAGDRIAFDSDCAYGESNVDGSSEIFQVTDTGTVTALTRDDSGTCDSINASSNADGTVVAFESDCDPSGTNPDFAVEIFTVTDAGVVTQATDARDDSCASMFPSIDAAGSRIAFVSDCDFTGGNDDRSQEMFLVGPTGTVTQLTSDPGTSPCSSSRPRISGSGLLVGFSSYCDPAGANGDGSLEVFQVAVGQAPAQLTLGVSCDSLFGDMNLNGRDVVFDSNCDPLGTNSDGGSEIFGLNACICGAPTSRKVPPKATDALFALRAAVGLVSCLPCECDTDSSGKIVTSDALRVLQAAVGLPVTLNCPAS